MGIEFLPEEFSPLRRGDTKRGAEARVVDALKRIGIAGHALYEFRYRKSGTQVDIALWLDRLARFAGQVKGGPHELDDAGQWLLRKPGGRLERVPPPLEEAVDGAIEMRNAIFEATGVKNFVAGLVIFPDMPRNEHWERVALNHDHVYILCGLDNLQADLERIAGEAQFFYHPKPAHSENEWRGLNRLQYEGAAEEVEGRQFLRNLRQEALVSGNQDAAYSAESITINIQRVDRLEVRHYHPGRDDVGEPAPAGA